MPEFDFEKLKEYAYKISDGYGEIVLTEKETLTGGQSPAELTRITLTLEDCSYVLSLVKKETYPTEVKVMLALAELENMTSLPEVIDHAWNPVSDDFSENWFITPFYEGTPLTFSDEVPADIIYTLARVHHHFQSQTGHFKSLFHVDRVYFARTLSQAVTALEKAMKERGNPIFEYGLEIFQKSEKDESIFQTLECLPVTLTHGDMHPTNMIRLKEGKTILLDWGNARIAPAMLDLSNLISINSENWQLYLTAREEISGLPLDSKIARLSYYWASIMTNSMYLPYAIRNTLPEHVEKMVEKVLWGTKEIKMLAQKE